MNSLTVGPNGPMLVEDLTFIDECLHFNRERIPARRVHAQGTGAFGYFEVSEDITNYTRAEIFSHIGKRTPILVRVSTGSGDKGLADTTSLLRGFAIKFYTKEGNWDLPLLDIPIFSVNDPADVFGFSRALKRNPATNLINNNMTWDFFTLKPESIHFALRLYSERAKPASFRHIDFFALNVFKLVNSEGSAVYCKFHLKTDLGFKSITFEKAKELITKDIAYYHLDFYNSIVKKQYPSWTLYIQLMTFKQAEECDEDIFDLTQKWSEKDYPLKKIGRIVLTDNPTNQFTQIEQASFAPGNMIPGIEPSTDRILQARLLEYKDTQIYRLGANHMQLPVNYPYRAKVVNVQRDGAGAVTNNGGGAPNYYPSRFSNLVVSSRGASHVYEACGEVRRHNSSNYSDRVNLRGVSSYIRDELNDNQRNTLAQVITSLLKTTAPFIQERALALFDMIDKEFGRLMLLLLKGD